SDRKKARTISESDLTGHLSNSENGEEKSDDTSASDDETEKDKSEKLSESDYQLFEALNLLKGLTIANKIQQQQG
ncbi:MAG: hypothetical protein KAU21_20535, partial [Gammaproteobacteria bacterium]|nr:hypothetical protein [Gammaproteobacteria bacterium]